MSITDREARRAYWVGMVREWEGSGESGAAFCRERDLVYSQFMYWRRRLSEPEEEKADAAPSETPDFVALSFADEGAAGCGVRVRLGTGVELLLDRGFDAAELRRAAEVLGTGRC